jgi:4-hydroxybenzoate polyprenyltransferase
MRPRDLIELVRAPAALSVPGDVFAGATAAAAIGVRTPVLAVASVCLYWAGMAANDWADRNVDAVERPRRPIPSGRVPAPVALGLAAALTAVGIGVAGAAGGRRAMGVALPLAGAVWAYDLVAKSGPAGPAVMAGCRGLDVLLGASAGRMTRALPAALTVAAHTYTVSALSRHEVDGARRRVPAATLAITSAIAAGTGMPPRSVNSRAHGWAGKLLAGWYAAQYGMAQTRALLDPSGARVRAAVATGITGLPALQGALVARAGNVPGALAVAAAAPLGGRLARAVSAT